MNTNQSVARKHAVVIVGGGTGGAATAARLRHARPGLDIVVIDPAEFHYYQPAWTLVGGGQYRAAATRRSLRDCLPSGVAHIAARVRALQPDEKQVVLEDGSRIGYDFLVVAAGIQLDWDVIEGLSETLGKNGVTSNYRYDLAPYTWECVRNFSGGTALFTQPGTPVKCPGAPQKALYLAADIFRKRRIPAKVHFCTAGSAIFGVPFYSQALEKVMASYDARVEFGHNLVAVDGAGKIAIFETTVDGKKQRSEIHFDLLHVVPPQSAPAFIRNSTLAGADGWLEVDKNSLRHVRYPNVFGLGDCTSTPNSKTAAAIKSQAPVMVKNLLRTIDCRSDTAQYDGYAACPLTTSVGKVMLAEFTYGGVATPSFKADPRVPRRFYWWLKKWFMPFLYWNFILKGRGFPVVHKKREFPVGAPSV
ncbi:MAG: NAD(P)/FAD-dependent oxidoreductase [Candidimonas sp.]|nr:MAG: NAD(P)/FAD-dependent oxidoreductase [Candidimonas sp.]TAM22442.1 MAG: NAD(P)/FAD-dependent oxidoreductase [Candidimonas sp.]